MSWAQPLPEHLMQRGGNPDLVGGELLHIIGWGIENLPRSLQKRIGPSEIGHPCARRIGYKLLGAPNLNAKRGCPWKPFVGTCVHHGLEGIFDQYNLAQDAGDGSERFLIEQKVCAGQINGEDIEGSTDIYDRVTATVIDWKVVGPTQLKKYKANGPGDQYRVQGHAYGRGWAVQGLPVDTVMVVFLPRNGELRDTVIKHEPYDGQIAVDGFRRAEGISLTVRTLGVAALEHLPTADAFCTRCPYFTARSTDLRHGCPGHPGSLEPSTPALSIH